MHVAVYLPLLLPLLAAVAARPLASRLPPAAATWLLTASTLALAAAATSAARALYCRAAALVAAGVALPALAGPAAPRSREVIAPG